MSYPDSQVLFPFFFYTAQPNGGYLPIIDKAGLVTPHWDGWSLDFWWVNSEEHVKTAARSDGQTHQRFFYGDNLAVVTQSDFAEGRLTSAVWLNYEDDVPYCKIRVRCKGRSHGRLVVALRPYNPEGISFLHTIALNEERTAWTINEKDRVYFDRPIETHQMQKYAKGDVANHLNDVENQSSISCDVGMKKRARRQRSQWRPRCPPWFNFDRCVSDEPPFPFALRATEDRSGYSPFFLRSWSYGGQVAGGEFIAPPRCC